MAFCLRYSYNIYLEIPDHIWYMSELEQLLEDESPGAGMRAKLKKQMMLKRNVKHQGLLQSLRTTNDYLGKNMTLSDVHRLTEKDVKKYYKMYQIVNGQQVCNKRTNNKLCRSVK